MTTADRPRSGRAIRTTCNHCDAKVLTGLNHGVGPNVAVVTPKPLDPRGEYEALIAGRATWKHSGYNGVLERRTPEQITKWVASSVPGIHVYADHECGTHFPETPNTLFAVPDNRGNDEIPF